jgi:hypothetical protein
MLIIIADNGEPTSCLILHASQKNLATMIVNCHSKICQECSLNVPCFVQPQQQHFRLAAA